MKIEIVCDEVEHSGDEERELKIIRLAGGIPNVIERTYSLREVSSESMVVEVEIGKQNKEEFFKKYEAIWESNTWRNN